MRGYQIINISTQAPLKENLNWAEMDSFKWHLRCKISASIVLFRFWSNMEMSGSSINVGQ